MLKKCGDVALKDMISEHSGDGLDLVILEVFANPYGSILESNITMAFLIQSSLSIHPNSFLNNQSPV